LNISRKISKDQTVSSAVSLLYSLLNQDVFYADVVRKAESLFRKKENIEVLLTSPKPEKKEKKPKERRSTKKTAKKEEPTPTETKERSESITAENITETKEQSQPQEKLYEIVLSLLTYQI
jgi:hypothetical protein